MFRSSVFVPITSSHSTRRECDYTFHTHLLLSSRKKKMKKKPFGVKRNLCEKKVDDNNEPKPKPKIIFEFHKFN